MPNIYVQDKAANLVKAWINSTASMYLELSDKSPRLKQVYCKLCLQDIIPGGYNILMPNEEEDDIETLSRDLRWYERMMSGEIRHSDEMVRVLTQTIYTKLSYFFRDRIEEILERPDLEELEQKRVQELNAPSRGYSWSEEKRQEGKRAYSWSR